MTDVVRASRCDYLEKRWGQLSEHTNKSAEEIWKYLMLVNSGGAVSLLGLMGAKQTLLPFTNANYVLIAFLVGVVLVGLGKAFSYYRLNFLFTKWRDDVTRFYSDDIGWENLNMNDKNRSEYFYWLDIIGWASFFCFLSALITTAIEVF